MPKRSLGHKAKWLKSYARLNSPHFRFKNIHTRQLIAGTKNGAKTCHNVPFLSMDDHAESSFCDKRNNNIRKNNKNCMDHLQFLNNLRRDRYAHYHFARRDTGKVVQFLCIHAGCQTGVVHSLSLKDVVQSPWPPLQYSIVTKHACKWPKSHLAPIVPCEHCRH